MRLMYGGAAGHEEQCCELRVVLTTLSAKNPRPSELANVSLDLEELSKIAARDLSYDCWRATRRAIAGGPVRRQTQ